MQVTRQVSGKAETQTKIVAERLRPSYYSMAGRNLSERRGNYVMGGMSMPTKRRSAAKKAARTRKLKSAGRKAAKKRVRRVVAAEASSTTARLDLT